jgi:hypothetical protein
MASPVVLLGQGVGMEESFKFMINSFGFTVCLRVVLRVLCCGHGLVNTKGVAEGVREGGSKLGPSIRYDFVRETKVAPYLIMIESSGLFCHDGGMTRGDDSGFCHIVIYKKAMVSYPRDAGSSVIKKQLRRGWHPHQGGWG